MFESISFFHNNKTKVEEPLDIGNLVECMLFYSKTTVFANRSILNQLLNYFGIEGVIELLSEELLEIKYSAFFTGIRTERDSNNEYHDPVSFFINDASFQTDIIKLCQDLTEKKGKGRRIGNRLKNLIIANEPENIVLDNARDTILNQSLILESSKSVINDLIPEKINLDNVNFETRRTSSGIVVETNLNFEEINRIYHKYIPESHSSISSASILGHIFAAENEIWLASNNSSEISSSLITSNLIPKKIDYLLDKSTESINQINRFSEFVFEESKSLREYVNKKKGSP